MLIAFNAAPGTVAPAEQGPYGAYAQSLAEMIRDRRIAAAGGFQPRAAPRQRNEQGRASALGRHKIDAQFMFFDRAPDAPAPPPQDQVAAVRNRPIRDIGVQDAYAAALERDTMQGYDDFLGAYPAIHLQTGAGDCCGAARSDYLAPLLPRRHAASLLVVFATLSPRAPCRRCPRRLAILTAALEPPPSFAVMDYDVPPPPPEESSTSIARC